MNSEDKIFLISLGCAKNLVDSEHALGMIRSKGFEFAARIEDAETVIINTCGFIRSAVEEAIDTILEVVELKNKGRLKKILVAGCFVQRYGYKLRREMPEVDGWFGTNEIDRIAEALLRGDDLKPAPFYIERPTSLADHTAPRIHTTPFFSAYLRISEGCSHRCTYCMIPRLRGPLRSRQPESLLIEAEAMAGRGVKEINLIGQDITMYGRDLGQETGLEDLLEKLVQIKGLQWIRLLYCHPARVSERLLELLDSEEKLCPYLDLPLQHVSGALLRTMGRAASERPQDVVGRIRARKRRISLRTSLMVGFPGESREMFQELYDFVKDTEFDHLGVFVFSPEKGTGAARLLPRVEAEEAERRRERLMGLQSEISEGLNRERVGQILPVLIEGPSPETDLLLTGRTSSMAPDVDGQVLINKGKGLVGEIMPVRITEAHAYDLIGELV